MLALLLVLMLLEAQAGKWHIAIPIFALAVLAKPQAGLLAPLGVAALLKETRLNEKRGKSVGFGLLGGVAVTLAVVLPFAWGENIFTWLVDKYAATLSGYPHATLSTGNLMFLLGGNWVDESTALIGGITYGQIGLVLMVLSFAAGMAVYFMGKGRSHLFLAAALTMQLLFALTTKMHERYILPALALLFFAYVETGDIRLLVSGVLASAASAVNIGVVLAYDYLIAPNTWLGYVLGAVQLAAAGLTAFTVVRLSLGRSAADHAGAQSQARSYGEGERRKNGLRGGKARARRAAASAGLPHAPEKAGFCNHGRADAGIRRCGVLPPGRDESAADGLCLHGGGRNGGA